ncbi:MAG: hypothetical protein RJA87_1390 [Pseudomonadota bacterium]|jgi:cytoplasmic iron level regulating protein YaaA (DUF328/UPF0246 family)
MLLVLSPAKSLDYTPLDQGGGPVPLTTPQLKADIAELAKVTAKLSRQDLRSMMSISEKLADLNFERFKSFDPACEDGLQAAMAFDGDVYDGLQARTLDRSGLDWAQDHLRILSGLYGILRPLDALQPYRLEMGTRLKTKRGSTLYDFWGARLAKALNEAAHSHPEQSLINLASQEYFGAVDAKALKLKTISCAFKDEKDGKLRILGFYAKKARGQMARFAIDGRIDRAEGLKDFAGSGYRFQPTLSTAEEWVFTRKQP